jgi:hypothetical protein
MEKTDLVKPDKQYHNAKEKPELRDFSELNGLHHETYISDPRNT